MQNLPVLLLVIVLLFPSATVLFLGIGNGGGTQGLAERTASALGTGNPPTFKVTLEDPKVGDYGVPIGFRVVVNDTDNDNLNVTWDWGDGVIETNFTPPAKILQIVQRDHTYYPAVYGQESSENYTLNISLDDGNGNIVWDLTTVSVTRPINYSPTIIGITVSPVGSKIRVNPGDEVTIVANASDPEGDPLNWTYLVSDSVSQYDPIYNYTSGTARGEIVWSNISYTFSAVGNYTIRLNLSDAPAPYDVLPHNVSADISIEVHANVAPAPGALLDVSPSNPVVRSEVGYVLVNFTMEAADEDGDALTALWDFDDGTPLVSQTSPGGTELLYPFIVQRNYTDAGSFNVSVTVTDGIPGHEILLTVFVQVNSTNLPPVLSVIEYNLSKGTSGMINEMVNFTLVITDPERDPIQVVVDFGDNSSRLYFNLTDFVANNVTFTFSHSYANPGTYGVMIWYTDNKTGMFDHQRLYNATPFEIKAPVVIVVESWSWWDYTSLGLLCMIPVLIVIRFARTSRRLKVLEEQGMTYDEWMLRKSMEADAPSSRKEGGA